MKSSRKLKNTLKALFGGGLILFVFFVFTGLASALSWMELLPTGGPPDPRQSHASVYDPNTNRMIVFGGIADYLGYGPLFNDVWVLENADGLSGTPNWTQISPSGTPPSPRINERGSVYDAANNRMIVFGGNPNVGYCYASANDVWVLENANGLGGAPNWIQLSPTGGPPSQRYIHTSVYDPATKRMIVFGGQDSCGPAKNDVWVLENANGLGGTPNWIQLSPAGGPPSGRIAHSAVYDPMNNRMIVFGGQSAGFVNDVWVLENANGLGGTPNWIQLSPTGGPPEARSHHSAIYDPVTNCMILFGGWTSAGIVNDVWVLENANGLGGTPNWIQLSPDPDPDTGEYPSGRRSHTGVYNPSTNRMIMFAGGSNVPSFHTLNDIWVLTDVIIGNQPPVANAGPDQTVEQEGYAGTLVTLDGSGSTDPDSTPGTNDDIVSFDWYEGETFLGTGEVIDYTFPLGEHTITLVVTDSEDEIDDDEVIIIVQDTTPPDVSVSAGKDSLWPPNHKMVDVGFSYEASDICDPEPDIVIEITSDEPTATAPGSGGPKHAPDAEITGDGEVLLRAERSGQGDGRVYVITATVTDESGNSASASASIKVNKNKKKAAVDSGQNYDATEIN